MSSEISVILPVYNGEKYLNDAIDSILMQTFKNFELIVINDGSTDRSVEVIDSYNDPRIVLISRQNRGLVVSLNEGIEKARSPFIARQDADDISEPTRLQKQYDYLCNNPDVVAVGSSISTINMAGKIINEHIVISGKKAVKSELLVRSPFAHGSVMMRKNALVSASKYLADDWPAEDYGLWVRMSKEGNLDNLKEPLYRYRENTAGISSTNSAAQADRATVAKDAAWHNSSNILRPFSVIRSTGDTNVDTRVFNNLIEITRRALKEHRYLSLFNAITTAGVSPILIKRLIAKIVGR